MTDMIEQDLNVDAEFQELLKKYQAAAFLDDELSRVTIVPRVELVGNWMKEGDLGFVYGLRGSGKTWFINLTTQHLGAGKPLHNWEIPNACNIVYVDGEMPAEDAKKRIEGLGVTGKVRLLNHELLWQESQEVMNLTDPALQRVITAMCVADKAKLLVLDNLSCLFRGIKENDNDAWEAVLNWLLDLRRQKIAGLIVHHAGRTGNGMRGASRREDAAFWVVKIEKIESDENGAKGAMFRTIFEKQRNSQEREWDKDWNIISEEDGKIKFKCSEVEMETRILELIKDGVEYASELAKALNCEAYTVSRKVKRLIDQRLVKKSGKRYVATVAANPRKDKHPLEVGDHNADMLTDRLPENGGEIPYLNWQNDCIQWHEMSPGTFLTLSNSLLELGKVKRTKQGAVCLADWK